MLLMVRFQRWHLLHYRLIDPTSSSSSCVCVEVMVDGHSSRKIKFLKTENKSVSGVCL